MTIRDGAGGADERSAVVLAATGSGTIMSVIGVGLPSASS
jgi:hypothetical protein